MLRLDFVKKPIEKQREIVDTYYQRILEHRDPRRLKKINEWCEKYLASVLIKIRSSTKEYPFFEKVVKADYKELKVIHSYLKSNNISLSDKDAGYMRRTMYERAIDKKEFVNKLQISVCPYCNRNFINSGIRTAGCQLDHFFNKSKYPILAASFYNLVPVCGSCNIRKRDEEFVHSPYDPDITADDLLQFTYLPLDLEWMDKVEGIEIDIKYLHHKMKIEKDMEKLEIKDLYQIHRDRVVELLKLAMIYDEVYMEQIVKRYPELFNNIDDLKRIITGMYSDEKDYGKRPLSKLLTDIGKECGLV